MDQSRIRNFSIIAHIDHGKSTLADRLLERTGAISEREMRAQLLDEMDLERERGITIKANAVRIDYDAADGATYELNIIDTPGHVDFSYEVSRSLEACEGALLLVDASQGIEAQTLANAYMAIESGLEVVPVINKIDLPAADPDRVAAEIANVIGGDPSDAIRVSAKSGEGVDELLEAIVHRLPAPEGDPEGDLRALVFDSYYDTYRGVVALIRVVDGEITKGDGIRLMASGEDLTADEIGVRRPAIEPTGRLGAGSAGYLITGVKDIDLIRVGDTVTWSETPAAEPLAGYAEPKPMVFSGLFPTDRVVHGGVRRTVEHLACTEGDPARIRTASGVRREEASFADANQRLGRRGLGDLSRLELRGVDVVRRAVRDAQVDGDERERDEADARDHDDEHRESVAAGFEAAHGSVLL